MKLVTIYGSPTPPGKLARALGTVESDVRERYPEWTVERLEPGTRVGPVVATWDSDAVDVVAAADAVVLASPVYRGSFTGTLKLLLDMLPNEALRSKPVGILTVAAAPEHFLSAERHLRDVLGWFGAVLTPNNVFFVDRAFATEEIDSGVLGELREFADQLTTLTGTLSGESFGPEPLTVRYRRKLAG